MKEAFINSKEDLKEVITKIENADKTLNAATEIFKSESEKQLSDLPDGPLKGIPFSIKECYGIKGKYITSGSLRMKPIYCENDSVVFKKLKAAGGIAVARGNTSEFLLGRETDNRLYGTTNNAINNELTAGGSSGGDAALIASGCVRFGVGTDIGGSCRYPAAFNGIVGFKPASGQIDKTGIFPSAGHEFVETLNSPGIMARSVKDIRMVYNVIGNKTLKENNKTEQVQIYTANNFRVKIKDDSISIALKAGIDSLKNKFENLKDIDIPEAGKLYMLFASLMCGGFTDKIYEWSKTEDGKNLSFIGELVRRIKGKPTISDELFSMLLPFNLLKPSLSKMNKVINEVEQLREKYKKILGPNGILILPTLGILAPKHKKFIPQYSKPGVIEIITPISFCNILNLSCITIPAKKYQRDQNINPPAIQLICPAGSEELLLNVAEVLEEEMN